MKRTFLAKRNALLSSANFSWGVFALAFALLALFVRLLAPNLFFHIFAPAFSAADTIAVTSRTFFNSFGDVAALTAKNEQLMNDTAALRSENQALLKAAAQIRTFAAASGILAGVVARPPESPYDTLVLAAGARAGIALGMEAFGEGGVPLGAVTFVTDDFSRVTLFSAPGMVTRGWIGSAGLPIDIFGAGAGAMQASLSRSAGIALGDIVFAPGPGMLPIGSVVRIDSDPSSPGIVLRIIPAINPFSLAWVQLRDIGAALRGVFLAATTTAL